MLEIVDILNTLLEKLPDKNFFRFYTMGKTNATKFYNKNLTAQKKETADKNQQSLFKKESKMPYSQNV